MAEVQDVVSGLPEGKQEQALEAVLFAAGEPVELEVLARAFGMPSKQMQELLDNMRFSYNQQNRGIQMLRLGNAYQLCTRQEYAACVHAVFDKKREVSLSAAYNQPVTRAFLEQVRGVDSSGVVASLLDKGLLEERGRLDVPGRPMQFGTTARFLRCFGLSSLEDLPPVDENGALIAQLQLEEQPEQP